MASARAPSRGGRGHTPAPARGARRSRGRGRPRAPRADAVGRREGLGSKPTAALPTSVALAHSLSSGWWPSPSRARPARPAARAAPAPAPRPRADRCRRPPRRAAPASARRRRQDRARSRMWPENVERLISIDCSSPMSASTSSNTGRLARTAGGLRPHWCMRAAQAEGLHADGLAAGVRAGHDDARIPRRSRSIGTRCRVEQRVAPPPANVGRVSTAQPPTAATARPQASTRSRAASTATARPRRAPPRGRAPTARPGCAPPPGARCRELAHAFLASTCRTARRTASGPSPRCRARCPAPRTGLALTASTGRPPRSVTKFSCRCALSCVASCRSLSVARPRACEISRRRPRSRGDALSRSLLPSGSTAASRRDASPPARERHRRRWTSDAARRRGPRARAGRSRPARAVSAIAASWSGCSTAERTAAVAAGRRRARRPDGELRRRSARRPRPSPPGGAATTTGSVDGASATASSWPPANDVSSASSARIASSSRTCRLCSSTDGF